MSETVKHTIRVRSTYEHTITVDVNMSDYSDWMHQSDTIRDYIEALIDDGDSIIIPNAEDGEFWCYEIVSVEPAEGEL